MQDQVGKCLAEGHLSATMQGREAEPTFFLPPPSNTPLELKWQQPQPQPLPSSGNGYLIVVL